MRKGQASIVANPVLVGAVTLLVVVVAVFLAYNANNGLPFVPTQSLKVRIANGANLVAGNEVRSGGYRVGVVEKMKPVRLINGKIGAELLLKLDRALGAIPKDSRAVIRPRSALGLKYVEFEKGTAKENFADGATLPARQTLVPVELDEFYNIFDRSTRRNSRVNLNGFGNAFVGRGEDLSTSIQGLARFFAGLQDVTSNLSDKRTRLDNFFKELGDAARIVAPISKTQAHLFTTMANTFEAFSRDEQALKDFISKGPDTLAVGERSFRRQRPFLRRTAAFSEDLKFAARDLQAALPSINAALEIGTPVTRRSVQLNEDLQNAMASLERLVRIPTTNGALRGLTATKDTLQPTLRYVGPFVTVCNGWNKFWTFNAEHQSSPAMLGEAQRALTNSAGPPNPENDSVGSLGANEFSHGRESIDPEVPPEELHNQYYGQAINPDGTANCQAGQQGYLNSANPFRDRNVGGKGDVYKNVATDLPPSDSPSVGPTYKTFDKAGIGSGRSAERVPAGQTFTDRPGGRGVDAARVP
jgi:virulence factor Mce-like protein